MSDCRLCQHSSFIDRQRSKDIDRGEPFNDSAAIAFYLSARRQLDRYRVFLWTALCSLPLPWIAIELGWIVAEYGRQPWAIVGVLPTALAVSSTDASNVMFSLIGFFVFYSALLVVDVMLLLKYIRLGPDQTLGHPVVPPVITTLNTAEA